MVFYKLTVGHEKCSVHSVDVRFEGHFGVNTFYHSGGQMNKFRLEDWGWGMCWRRGEGGGGYQRELSVRNFSVE